MGEIPPTNGGGQGALDEMVHFVEGVVGGAYVGGRYRRAADSKTVSAACGVMTAGSGWSPPWVTRATRRVSDRGRAARVTGRSTIA
jgi:hypothetical protein